MEQDQTQQELPTAQQLVELMETFINEDAKFVSGNAAAGTRARNALGKIAKLAKVRRSEISASRAELKAVRAAKRAA